MIPKPAAVLGLGSAAPPNRATQSQALRLAIETAALSGDAARFAQAIYPRSGVHTRSSVLLKSAPDADARLDQSFFRPSAGPGDRGPTTAARMRAYAALAPPLATVAADRALRDARISPHQITHLITVSCTGFSAPGVETALIASLNLHPDVQRLSIGFMGCHGGIVGLRTAQALAGAPASAPAHVLLVCVELCSLHFQYSDRPDQIVANALFADGAAAAIIGPEPAAPSPTLRLRSAAGTIFPDTTGAMTWNIADHGFEMSLSESVPALIRASLGPWLGAWLSSCGLPLGQARTDALWAIHPGGPKVLDAVAEALELGRDKLAPSREVLSEFGNMSSPTSLFILERILRPPSAATDAPIIMIGFGPGLSVEAALLALEPAPASGATGTPRLGN